MSRWKSWRLAKLATGALTMLMVAGCISVDRQAMETLTGFMKTAAANGTLEVNDPVIGVYWITKTGLAMELDGVDIDAAATMDAEGPQAPPTAPDVEPVE